MMDSLDKGSAPDASSAASPSMQQGSDSSTSPPNSLHNTMKDLARVNVPEKIVICLDLHMDPYPTYFHLGSGSRSSPLSMMSRVIQLFLYNKQLLSKKHEFALMLLYPGGEVMWMDFTNDPKELVEVLKGLQDMEPSKALKCDLSKLFADLQQHVPLPIMDEPSSTIPPYIVRVVLLYARSYSMPVLSNPEPLATLKQSPCFFLDLLHLHEPLYGPTKVPEHHALRIEEVLCRLTQLLCKDSSYVKNVARNSTELHNFMSKLLAHPLQRPPQEEACYRLLK